MEDKDLNYRYYHKEVVDIAKDYALSFYKENCFVSDLKSLELSFKLPEKSSLELQNLIYKQMIDRIESAYLAGMQYAISNNIGSIKPTHETQLCQYQKDKDFAFIFKFGDNDFGNHFEHAAKLYCEAYNSILGTICTYSDYAPKSIPHYTNDIDILEKRETIIKCLKIGVASYTFQRDIDSYHPEHISFEKSMGDANRYANEYFDFNGSIQMWKKNENNEYIPSGTKPRLIIGTRAEIDAEILHYGHPDEESLLSREFPVWCNGEALIVYMKDGFLTYLIR